MVTVVCKESGIEFEAASKRTQQHPDVAALKNAANKNGNYREVNEALSAVRKAGGYSTIEEFMVLVGNHINSKKEEQNRRSIAAAQAREKENAEIEARKEARRKQNEHLKVHGYTWHKYDVYDVTQEVVGSEWKLISADGRFVSVEQALDEIARGVDVVVAEAEAKSQEAQAAAITAAEIEAKRQADEDATDDAAYAAFDTAVEQVKQKTVRVKAFDFSGFSKAVTMSKVSTTYRRYDCIYKGTLNGVLCYVVFTDSGYDYDGSAAYYSEDATTAGLEMFAPDDSENNVGRWF